jgi:sugar/nucleoside kinase (ribokinase family)
MPVPRQRGPDAPPIADDGPMTDPPVVVCAGIAVLDAIVLVPEVPVAQGRVVAQDGALTGGGVAATAAVALARLGVSVAMVAHVGTDAAARLIVDGLASEGVDVSAIGVRAGRSGLSSVLVESGGGGRALAPFAGDVGELTLSPGAMALCRRAAWVHVDHAGWRVVPELRAAGVAARISVDGGNSIAGLDLADIDLYAPTEEAIVRRAGAELPAAIEAALDEGARLVVVTRGAEGSLAAWREGASTCIHAEPAFAVPVRSTLGAGDVFHGALLAALVEGASVPDALRSANAVAGLACRALDGRSGIPVRAERDAYLAAHPRAEAGA